MTAGHCPARTPKGCTPRVHLEQLFWDKQFSMVEAASEVSDHHLSRVAKGLVFKKHSF